MAGGGDPHTMTIAVIQTPDARIELDLRPWPDLSDAAFAALCAANRDLRIERTESGEIVIMPPTGAGAGYRNLRIGARLDRWAETDGTGVGFASSTGFVLPNGATRSPDAGWVRRERLAALTPEQKDRFLPLAPDFAIELRSPTDRLPDLLAKMAEYIANGVQLAWLIDPIDRATYEYRPGSGVVTANSPDRLTGDPDLPGFVLDLTDIWEPGW